MKRETYIPNSVPFSEELQRANLATFSRADLLRCCRAMRVSAHRHTTNRELIDLIVRLTRPLHNSEESEAQAQDELGLI